MISQPIICRFCGRPARFIDAYLAPFQEDGAIFHDMNIYYCDEQSLGFVEPMPTAEALQKYYHEIYRDSRRLCAEDPHKYYTVVKTSPLVDSQFMYLSQFIDFSKLQTVIDMGCGHGLLLRRIHRDNPNIRLTGIELDPAVSEFMKDIGAEVIQASAGDSVSVIAERITDNTLLISSHTLHYQNDYTFLNEIIRGVKKTNKKMVHLFVEVPNDPLNDQEFLNKRVYDVSKLMFFTAETFRKGLLELETLNVSTTGWALEQELVFRQKRLDQYQGNQNLFINIMRLVVKFIIPLSMRKALKTILFEKSNLDGVLAYYSYGGRRRAIRMIGKVS